MTGIRQLFMVALILGGLASSAQAQWRGHYVHKRGVFGREVERLHWGNGLTPQGAQLIGQGLTLAAPIVADLLGAKGLEDEAASKDLGFKSTLASGEHYAREQARANDLLERTAALVNNLPPLTTTTPSTSTGTPRAAKLQGDPVTEQLFQPNPWRINP